MGEIVKQSVATRFSNSLYENFIPSFVFVQEKRSEEIWFADRQITELVPLYGYVLEQKKEKLLEDEMLSLDEILLEEAKEGTLLAEEETGKSMQVPSNTDTVTANKNNTEETDAMSLDALLQAENEAAMLAMEELQGSNGAFIPHTLQSPVNIEELQNYEKLVTDFYTIDSNTMAGNEQLDVNKLLAHDMTISKEGDAPQILIYHTHSQEAFADSVPGDAATSIIGVGDRLAQILTETYGYQVMHHTGQYDVDSRDDAYSASLPAIEQVLAENPSIEVVIDLHRDQMAEETRLVMDLDGRPTARFMFFNGLSRTRKTGDISYLYNENQEENLAFSFQMKLKAEEYYPGLTRKNYLKGYRYNMHLRPKTLLIELGAQNNTVEEAMNACDPLAHILDMVLTGQ
ncbi:MAG: stage II sporulation protein P [Lachnospiraceae bacterium]|nr:stage II sporulation protein P [Lachnospiraceae bacterium]